LRARRKDSGRALCYGLEGFGKGIEAEADGTTQEGFAFGSYAVAVAMWDFGQQAMGTQELEVTTNLDSVDRLLVAIGESRPETFIGPVALHSLGGRTHTGRSSFHGSQ
jgi:hypothetical protein